MPREYLFNAIFCLIFCLISLYPLHGQSLKGNLQKIFDDVLGTEFQTSGSPGEHGNHFLPSRSKFSAATIDAFSNFVTANISSFPLTSTSAGLAFDFSSGEPVITTTSLGPIFSERAQTLGKWRFNLGINFNYLGLDKLRGIDISQTRFTFTHEDVEQEGLGDNINEFDTVDLFMDLKLDAAILAFIATVGITNRLDIGVAVPFVNVSMQANPRAEITSFSNAFTGSPNHFYGDSLNPQLEKTLDAVDDNASGIGDIAFRAKYNFLKDKVIDMAGLVEYRAATGNSANFLGVGDPSLKGVFISSATLGNFGPHLNLGYNARLSDLQRDQFEVFLGFDQKLAETFTLVVDVLGRFELGSEIEQSKFPEDIPIKGNPGGELTVDLVRNISVTNIPLTSNDHIIDAAFGFKFAPKEGLLFLGNIFVPLNDGGLRSDIAPTVGVEFTF